MGEITLKDEVNVFMTVKGSEETRSELGIDKNGNLYVNEKRVITKQKLTLSLYTHILTTIIALSTFSIAICDIAELWYN